MKVKKFIAPSMPEAMQKIREDLGDRAVILQSKEVKRGGIFGLFKKKNIEVIAGLDPHPLQEKAKKTEPPVPRERKSSLPDHAILNEIKQLKKMIHLQTNSMLDSDRPEYELVLHHLQEQEVEEDVAREIINAVIENNAADQDVSYETVIQACGDYIEKKLKPFPVAGMLESQVIQFVGPTGVGKTTTIAKVAARLILKELKKVAFITTDTYRIAAVEQLKTYASILNAPLEVAYSLDDFKEAVDKLKAYDVILVDTAGRNFREQKYVDDFKEILSSGVEIDTYLVMALTAKPKDIQETFDQFQSIPKEAVIFTKIDETTQYGSIINIAFTRDIDIAFLTNGQGVPDDLLVAEPKLIRDLLIGDASG